MSKGVQLKDNTGEKVYPRPYYAVGDLYLTTNTTNPNLLFGGVWQLFGPGRCLVCVDTSQTEFNTVLKEGGSKYLQAHVHTMGRGNDNNLGSGPNQYGWQSTDDKAGAYATNSTGDGDSGNLQPYITCYVWLRTA